MQVEFPSIKQCNIKQNKNAWIRIYLLLDPGKNKREFCLSINFNRGYPKRYVNIPLLMKICTILDNNNTECP